jgi:hypothetical protein
MYLKITDKFLNTVAEMEYADTTVKNKNWYSETREQIK